MPSGNGMTAASDIAGAPPTWVKYTRIIYDRYGYKLGAASRKKGSDKPVTVKVNAKREGKHFIMVQQKSGDKTAYSVRAYIGESSDVPTPDF